MFELPFYICELPLGKLSLSELAFGEQWVAPWLSLLVVQYPLNIQRELWSWHSDKYLRRYRLPSNLKPAKRRSSIDLALFNERASPLSRRVLHMNFLWISLNSMESQWDWPNSSSFLLIKQLNFEGMEYSKRILKRRLELLSVGVGGRLTCRSNFGWITNLFGQFGFPSGYRRER